MVEKPTDYIWSSARFQVTDNKSGFLEPVWKDPVERQEYEKFLNASGKKEENDMVKKRTYAGKPIGSEKFTEKIVEMLGIVINPRPKGRPRKHLK